jgi:hypothetical protein
MAARLGKQTVDPMAVQTAFPRADLTARQKVVKTADPMAFPTAVPMAHQMAD